MMAKWRVWVIGLVALSFTVTVAPERASAMGDKLAPSIVTKGSAGGKGAYYVVRRGDTLWDICSARWGKSWFWPTLWSYNPQITNPHWIYPGDLLLMRGSSAPKGGTFVWSESRYSQTKSDIEALARWVSFIPGKAVEEAGAIVHAREEKEVLGEYDEVYVSFKKDTTVKRGERFTIYSDEGVVEHPQTGEIVGRKIRQLGVARVLDAKNDYVKALIIKSYQEIKRGDKLTNILPHSWVVNPAANAQRVLATIVDHDNAALRFGGQWQYVLLDKGKTDGVARGNRFIIQRRGDGMGEGSEPATVTDDEDEEKERNKFPWENVGEVMVVKSFAKTSLGVVVRSIRELSRGERLLMKKGY